MCLTGDSARPLRLRAVAEAPQVNRSVMPR